ncbi:MAG TPA: hypothetical protein PLE54_06115 [Burkholderiaceae bacterium]|nr:hypothetical protein [Burkholderiaceae bacterium]
MQTSKILAASLLAIGMAAGAGIARADSNDATCEVHKDGDKQKGKSGPCTFSQRQGYIDIDLKNGDTISLSPAGGANHYRDQRGNKVTRTSAGTTGMSLKWESGKRVDVTWGGNRYGNPYYDSSSNSNSYGAPGKHSGHASGRNYGINPLDNGAFEVVSSNPFCTVRFNRHGEAQQYSDECTPEQKRESYEYAQRNR